MLQASSWCCTAENSRCRCHLYGALICRKLDETGTAQKRQHSKYLRGIAFISPFGRWHFFLDFFLSRSNDANAETTQVRSNSLEFVQIIVIHLISKRFRNAVKLALYQHFTNTLIFAVAASLIFMLWSIYFHQMATCLTVSNLLQLL